MYYAYRAGWLIHYDTKTVSKIDQCEQNYYSFVGNKLDKNEIETRQKKRYTSEKWNNIV